MLLETRETRPRKHLENNKFIALSIDSDNEEILDNFYLSAARNCVRFYLQGRPKGVNSSKYHSFELFLSMSAAQAKKSNVWRWYFRTGGHPPYDPNKRY